MSPPSTGGLVRAWRAARPGSFAALHDRLSPSLRVWAEVQVPRALRARIDPEELVHEVWLAAWRDFERFDPARGAFRAWVFGIAYNLLRGQLRAWRRTAPATGLHGLELAEHATSVTGRVSRRLDLGALHAALDELDEVDRAVAVYRGLEGLPHREVAHRTGLSEDAAETRWRRLRPRLRRLAERIGLL